MRVHVRTTTIAALALLAGFAPARAQAPVSVTVTGEGAPVAAVDVRVLVEGEMWEVGTTGQDGRVVAPHDLVGLAEGDLVAVHRVVCGGRTTALLVPPGGLGDVPCPSQCECGSLGAFLWGDDVRIDLTGLGLAVRERAEEAPPPPARERPERVERVERAARAAAPRWVVGAGGGWAVWPNLDLGCGGTAGAGGCALESQGPVARAAVEFRPWPDRRYGVAIDGSYATGLEVDRTIPPGSVAPGGAMRNVVEADVWSVGGFGVARHPVREDLEAFVGVGWVWSGARAEVVTTFPGDLTTTDERDDSGGRVAGRAGLDWRRAGSPWGVRLELGGMTGEEDDIGAGWHVAGLIVVPVGER